MFGAEVQRTTTGTLSLSKGLFDLRSPVEGARMINALAGERGSRQPDWKFLLDKAVYMAKASWNGFVRAICLT